MSDVKKLCFARQDHLDSGGSHFFLFLWTIKLVVISNIQFVFVVFVNKVLPVFVNFYKWISENWNYVVHLIDKIDQNLQIYQN